MTRQQRRQGPGPSLGGVRVATCFALAVWWGASGCGPRPEAKEPAIETAQVEVALGRARASADELGRRLMAALGSQLESDVPAAAITVCSEIAPAIAREISHGGVEIRRTSARYRNPENAPDAWERAWLERFEASVADGSPPGEVYEFDQALGELRYLRPIVVGSGCLLCHGGEDAMDGEVKARLAERYPQDLATGYAQGDLRGAFSVRVMVRNPAG